MNAESITLRLKSERTRLGLTQPEVAMLCNASKRSIIEWEKKTPIPSDKLAALGETGFDTQYILTGNRSENLPKFEENLIRLERVTNIVTKIINNNPAIIDTMKLGRHRDLAFETGMNEEQIKRFFNLIENSSDIFPSMQSTINIEMIEAGLTIAFKCIDVGNAQNLTDKAKTEFIIYVIKDLIEKHSIETPAIQNTAESNVTYFMEYLKKQQANGG